MKSNNFENECLVTGSEGLIGSSIIGYLLKEKYTIIKIDEKLNLKHNYKIVILFDY